MPFVKVRHRETTLDIAVLAAGSVTGIFDLALLNNISLTNDLVSGELLATGPVISDDSVTELKSRKAKPSHSIIPIPGVPLKIGIGYWKIRFDFKVT